MTRPEPTDAPAEDLSVAETADAISRQVLPTIVAILAVALITGWMWTSGHAPASVNNPVDALAQATDGISEDNKTPQQEAERTNQVILDAGYLDQVITNLENHGFRADPVSVLGGTCPSALTDFSWRGAWAVDDTIDTCSWTGDGFTVAVTRGSGNPNLVLDAYPVD